VAGGHEASFTLRGDYLRYGGEDCAFFTSLYPSLSFNVDFATLTLDLGWVRKDYLGEGFRGREGDYRSVGLRVGRKFLDGGLELFAGGRASDESTRDFAYNYSGYELFAGLSWAPTPDLSWSLSYRWRQLEYEAEVTLFGRRREDEQRWLDLGLTYKLPESAMGDVSLEAGCSLTRRESSIPLYAYDRNQVFVAIRFGF
jgi:opacity protein-like surface antigen